MKVKGLFTIDNLGVLLSLAIMALPLIGGTYGSEHTDRPVESLSQGCGFVSLTDFTTDSSGMMSLNRSATYHETNFRNLSRLPVCNENRVGILKLDTKSDWTPTKPYTVIVNGKHQSLAVR